MGKQVAFTTSFSVGGKEYTLETGKLASLAHGSVVLRQGNTMILATVVSDKEAKPGQGFFPLSVDYREKFAAAGRIPGNFFKRETRISDYEILISRLIDRACRPLFPDNYMNETQVNVILISGDAETLPDALAGLAASAAFMVSDIPFEGPIGECRVAKINGEYVVNPTRSEQALATLDIIVGASAKDIMMVEGEAEECQEHELIEAIKVGHEAIKIMCEAQLKLREACSAPATRAVAEAKSNADLKAFISEFGRAQIYEVAKTGSTKGERKEKFSAIDKAIAEAVLEKFGEEFVAENKELISHYTHKLNKDTIRDVVLTEKTRLDGRQLTEVRNIWSEIDYLPATHGSAVFTRGETQSLTTITLGSKKSAALIDNALMEYEEEFMLQYNFPSFCTGETKPNRGPSRREVGHGNLARRSVERMLPDDRGGYVIRVVSDILESNGSSSMATVCAASLALMDSGVKMKKQIAGIAMGLIADDKGRAAVLTDILGDEDHLGDMDFKVTGTVDGICGVQMDMKIDGMPYELLERALAQAKDGRIHIIGEMNKTIDAPRAEMKDHTPRIEKIEIDSEFIGAIIGTGGKVIQGIQRSTQTVIDIEEKGKKGIVTIASTNAEGLKTALKIIKGLTSEPEIGEEFDGKVVKIADFGAFVEYTMGKEALVHISEMSWARVASMADTGLKDGDILRVMYMGIDEQKGKARLSHKATLPKPEGYVEPERRPREERSDRPDFRRDDRRDDRRGGNDRNNRR